VSELSCRSGVAQGQRAAIDEATRTATFVVATEAPVSMWPGAPGEVLRMRGCDLSAYRRNPVVVDAHQLDVKSILGTSKARVEGRQLLADVTYDTTPEGEAAWARVKSGSLRAASIRYEVDPKKVRRLGAGERDGDVEGPAFVVDGWTLREVTMCAVGRDRDALRRSHGASARGLELTPETVKAAIVGARSPGEPRPLEADLELLRPAPARASGLTPENVLRALKSTRSGS
jgi:hypothetical protein